MKAICVCVLFFTLAAAAIAETSDASIAERLVYKKVEDRELSLYVSRPSNWKATDKRPAIVFFHGGGWVGGKPSLFSEHCKYLASRGMVAITVEYRLLDKASKESPLKCVQDAKSAMRWVRARSIELGIDSDRIAAGGGSAGGHLAAFCGMVEGKDDPSDDSTVSPKPQALVLYNPVYNNGPGQWGHARVQERFKEFSPAHNITADDPPAVVFLGSKDHLISVDIAKQFQADMKKVGIRSDLHIYDGQKHGFYGKGNPKYFYETLLKTDRFLTSIGWLEGTPTLEKPRAHR